MTSIWDFFTSLADLAYCAPSSFTIAMGTSHCCCWSYCPAQLPHTELLLLGSNARARARLSMHYELRNCQRLFWCYVISFFLLLFLTGQILGMVWRNVFVFNWRNQLLILWLWCSAIVNQKFSCDSSNEVSKWLLQDKICYWPACSVASPKYKFDQKVTDVATILLKVVIWLLVFDIYNLSKTKYFDTCYERLYLYVIPINLHHFLLTSLFILKL